MERDTRLQSFVGVRSEWFYVPIPVLIVRILESNREVTVFDGPETEQSHYHVIGRRSECARCNGGTAPSSITEL